MLLLRHFVCTTFPVTLANNCYFILLCYHIMRYITWRRTPKLLSVRPSVQQELSIIYSSGISTTSIYDSLLMSMVFKEAGICTCLLPPYQQLKSLAHWHTWLCIPDHVSTMVRIAVISLTIFGHWQYLANDVNTSSALCLVGRSIVGICPVHRVCQVFNFSELAGGEHCNWWWIYNKGLF